MSQFPPCVPNSTVIQHRVILPGQYLFSSQQQQQQQQQQTQGLQQKKSTSDKKEQREQPLSRSFDAIADICHSFADAEKQANEQLLILLKYIYGPLHGTAFEKMVSQMFPEAADEIGIISSPSGRNPSAAASGDFSPICASPMNAIGLKQQKRGAMKATPVEEGPNDVATSFENTFPSGADESSNVKHAMSSMDGEAIFSNLPELFKRHTIFVKEMLSASSSCSSSPSSSATALGATAKPAAAASSDAAGESSSSAEQTTSPNALLAQLLSVASSSVKQQQPQPPSFTATVDPAVVLSATLGIRVYNPRSSTPTPVGGTSSQLQAHSRDVSASGTWFPAVPQHMRYLSTGGYTSRSQANLMFGGSSTPGGKASQGHLGRGGGGDGGDSDSCSTDLNYAQQQQQAQRMLMGGRSNNAAVSSPANLVLPQAVDDFLSELYVFGCNFFRRSSPMLIALIDLVAKIPASATTPSASGAHQYIDPLNASSIDAAAAFRKSSGSGGSGGGGSSTAAAAAAATSQFGASSFDALSGMPTWSSDRIRVVNAVNALAEHYEVDTAAASIYKQIETLLPEMDPEWIAHLQQVILARESAVESGGNMSFTMPATPAAAPAAAGRGASPAPSTPATAAAAQKESERLIPGNNSGGGGGGKAASDSPDRPKDFAHSVSLPLHWLLFLLASPIRSLRRLHAFAQDILAVYATSGIDPVYSLNPEAEMASLAQFVHRMELQLLEFDQLCYESCSMMLTRNALRRFDVVGPHPLPPHPQRVLLLRGYVQKKIPSGRHTKVLLLFDDLLVYGEDTETGRIKITTTIPLMALPPQKDDSGGGFFSRLFGGGDKDKDKTTGGNKNTSSLIKQQTSNSSSSSHQESDPDLERTMKNIREASSAAKMEPYVLQVRDVPDDVTAGVVPSAYDQGAASQASDTTATYFRTNAFEVVTRTRSYVFYSPTVTEKAQWLAALRYAMEAAKARHAPSPAAAAAAAASAGGGGGNKEQHQTSSNSSNTNAAAAAAAAYDAYSGGLEEEAEDQINSAIVRETAKRLAYLRNGYNAEVANFREIETRSTSRAGVTHMVFDGCAVQLALFPSQETQLTAAAADSDALGDSVVGDGNNVTRLPAVPETANIRLEKLLRKENSRFVTQMCHGITSRGGPAAVLTPGGGGGGGVNSAMISPSLDPTQSGPPENPRAPPLKLTGSAAAAAAATGAGAGALSERKFTTASSKQPTPLKKKAAAAQVESQPSPQHQREGMDVRHETRSGVFAEEEEGEGLLGGTIRSLPAMDDEISPLEDDVGGDDD